MKSARDSNSRPEPANNRGSARQFRARFALLGLFALILGEASAEFHVWRDADGRKHVSTIPAPGYRADRTVHPAYDPNSIVYQHHRMLEDLRSLGEALEQQAAEARREAVADAAEQPAAPVRRGPAEGTMNLDELIALEKRGGRWLDDEPQGGAERAK